MRADRLIQMLILLQNHHKLTTQQLASMLEVSNRTIARDMDALSFVGIPVVAERGRNGGWKLMDHFRSVLSGMKLDDMKALFILPSETMLAELGIQSHGQELRQKILANLPTTTKSQAQHFIEKIYIDTDAWKTREGMEKDKDKGGGKGGGKDGTLSILSIVQKALWEDRKLTIGYKKLDGTHSERIICPLGLVAKGSVWYIVALNDQQEYRSFRLSRITSAVIEAESFSRPEQFNLGAYWQESKQAFAKALPSFEVRVLVERNSLARMTLTDRFVEKVDVHEGVNPDVKPDVNPDVNPGENGQWVEVALNLNTEQEAIAYLLSYGTKMKLIQPEYLIEKICDQAHAIITMYK